MSMTIKILCSICLQELFYIEKDGAYILTNACCDSCISDQVELSRENQFKALDKLRVIQNSECAEQHPEIYGKKGE